MLNFDPCRQLTFVFDGDELSKEVTSNLAIHPMVNINEQRTASRTRFSSIRRGVLCGFVTEIDRRISHLEKVISWRVVGKNNV